MNIEFYASDLMRGVLAEGFFSPIKIEVGPLILHSFARRRKLCPLRSDAYSYFCILMYMLFMIIYIFICYKVVCHML